MSELRGKVVFEWLDQWYVVDGDFKYKSRKYVLLPNGKILKHRGDYPPITMCNFADLADYFYEVKSEKELAVARKEAMTAKEVDKQYYYSSEEEGPW